MQTIAADIGTTTVVVTDGDRTVSFPNPQRKMGYGHDVVSRIRHAVSGDAEHMRRVLWNALLLHIEELEKKAPLRLVIAANTVMQHILFGDCCEGLAAAPFTPETLAARRYRGGELEKRMNFAALSPEAQEIAKRVEAVYAFPGISAFVGGDIVAGLYALNLFQVREPTLFLDLGTNGELVLMTPKRGFAASTAAGPAFEAANISCGRASVPGVIAHVEIRHGLPRVEVIPSKQAFAGQRSAPLMIPTGICGSGVIDTVYELWKNKLIDENGTYRSDRDRMDGYVLYRRDEKHTLRFTQEDVRAVQTAKAAVFAGITILLEEAGIRAAEVKKVCLAGAFGTHLAPEKLCVIGLLPAEFLNITVTCGNTALKGAEKAARDFLYGDSKQTPQKATENPGQMPQKTAENPEQMSSEQQIQTRERFPLHRITPVSLADHPSFEKAFIEAMNLGKTEKL